MRVSGREGMDARVWTRVSGREGLDLDESVEQGTRRRVHAGGCMYARPQGKTFGFAFSSRCLLVPLPLLLEPLNLSLCVPEDAPASRRESLQV